MLNYQGLYYKKYYVQDRNGKLIQSNKKACFAPAEPPSEENPNKQRWFYELEASYAVRLYRTKANEELHRFNSSSLKQDERYRDGKLACVWENKKTAKCDQDCARCNRKNTSRTVELDKSWIGSDGEVESSFSPIDETQNIFSMVEEKEFISILLPAYESLSPEDKELFNCLMRKEKKKVIADKLAITIDGVRYRELQLRKKLLSYKDLKRYLNK